MIGEIGDAVDRLCNPVRSAERVSSRVQRAGRRRQETKWVYTTTLPSMLEQLAQAHIPGTYLEFREGSLAGHPESTPPGRLDAISRYLTIERDAIGWAYRLALTPWRDLTRLIRSLVGGAATADSGTQEELLRDLERWYIWAATVSGWIRPPDRPRAPCPACERIGGLRVRLDTRTAYCAACGAAWTPETIVDLADYVRTWTPRKSENGASPQPVRPKVRKVA